MTKIEDSIMEHYSVSAPETLVNYYRDLIESNRFSIDPVVIALREQDSKIYNKINYTLEDESTVSIDESLRDKLKTLLSNKYDVIEYMNESKEHFFKVVQLII